MNIFSLVGDEQCGIDGYVAWDSQYFLPVERHVSYLPGSFGGPNIDCS